MSDNFFYKPKEGDKLRILPNMDFGSLYSSTIRMHLFGGKARRSKIKKILKKIYDSGRN